MIQAFIDGSISQENLLLAAIFIGLFVLWVVAKQFRAFSVRLRRRLKLAALLELLLFPAAALGIGMLAQGIFTAADLPEWEEWAAALTELSVLLATAAGIANIIVIRFQRPSHSKFLRPISHLVKTTIYVGVILVALIVFFIMNDYSTTKLYISTGALAAILAFAMQQTLGDLFSGIALGVERPFHIGDWLRFDDGTEGQVIDINWRSTHLKSWSEGTYVIPNALLSRQRFLNLHGADHPYADFFYIDVSGDIDPTLVVSILNKGLQNCESILQEPAPTARLMDGSKIPFKYYVWVYFRNYPSMFAGREEVYIKILDQLMKAGLHASAPVQEIRHRTVNVEPLNKSR
jgi:small-conductance mechanosensitive channel